MGPVPHEGNPSTSALPNYEGSVTPQKTDIKSVVPVRSTPPTLQLSPILNPTLEQPSRLTSAAPFDVPNVSSSALVQQKTEETI